MIRILVLAAFLVIGSAVEETKTSVNAAKVSAKKEEPIEKVEDANSEPSSLHSYYGSENNRVWDSRNSRGDALDLSEEENRIVQDVYSPDYYEPNIILDYRYLKSGGRGYARSDGGQILILPRRNHMPISHNNYDTLIEYLRLKHLEEMERKWGKVLRHEHDEHRGPEMYDDYGEGHRV
ncbi:jg18614 [Pararge aegeria aegeria]|uniref:Jg18614 protein n=1 Tax=Pararge aegeria aegeria TaxID=348720 RepID=A0A8S4R7W7_9NEOP|nr:jg18614 [Pararge aegeria aegeria]